MAMAYQAEEKKKYCFDKMLHSLQEELQVFATGGLNKLISISGIYYQLYM